VLTKFDAIRLTSFGTISKAMIRQPLSPVSRAAAMSGRQWRGPAAEIAQRERRDARADQGRKRIRGRGCRPGEGRVHPDGAEDRQPHHALPELADSEDADHGGEDNQDPADTPDQDSLVAGTELSDREVLDRAWRMVDGELANGSDWCADGGAEQGGSKLSYAERYQGRDDADERSGASQPSPAEPWAAGRGGTPCRAGVRWRLR